MSRGKQLFAEIGADKAGAARVTKRSLGPNGYDPKVKVEEGIPRFVEWFTKHELKAS